MSVYRYVNCNHTLLLLYTYDQGWDFTALKIAIIYDFKYC